MNNQSEINEKVIAYFKAKGYVLTALKHHYWLLCYESNLKIVKIGKVPSGANVYRKELAFQNTPTYQINTLEQAKNVVGEKPKPSQAEMFLILLKERGQAGVDADIAKEGGVNNITASAKILGDRGYDLMKIPRNGYRADGKDGNTKTFYIYIGKTKKMEI